MCQSGWVVVHYTMWSYCWRDENYLYKMQIMTAWKIGVFRDAKDHEMHTYIANGHGQEVRLRIGALTARPALRLAGLTSSAELERKR